MMYNGVLGIPAAFQPLWEVWEQPSQWWVISAVFSYPHSYRTEGMSNLQWCTIAASLLPRPSQFISVKHWETGKASWMRLNATLSCVCLLQLVKSSDQLGEFLTSTLAHIQGNADSLKQQSHEIISKLIELNYITMVTGATSTYCITSLGSATLKGTMM